MAGFLRVRRPPEFRSAAESSADVNGPIGDFFERLVQLIPGEVTAFYVVGAGFIDETSIGEHFAWTILSLVLLFLLRGWATRDKVKGVQWKAVTISAIAFLIWLYAIGGPFKAAQLHWPDVQIHVPRWGSLAVIAWSTFIPLVYQGD